MTESLALTGILALSVILTPLVAQNDGAKQQSRLDQAVALSGRMTVYASKLLNEWLVRQDSSLVGHNPLIDYVNDIKGVLLIRKRD